MDEQTAPDTEPTEQQDAAPRPKREGARTHRGRRLDRLPEPSRNADYMLREEVQRRELDRERVIWQPGPILDQGEDGACVAFGWTQEALSSPVRVDLTKVALPPKWPSRDPDKFAKRLYFAAQRHDQWEGGAYEGADPVYDGTSVVAGAKQMRRLGFIQDVPGAYRWAFNWEELASGVLAVGPAVIGVGWRDSMFDPTPVGVLKVDGPDVGGHCVLVNGYEPDLGGYLTEQASGDDAAEQAVADAIAEGVVGALPAFRITNSWSEDWGDGGGAWILASDMQTLLDDGGDAALVLKRSYGPQKDAA